MSDVKCGICGQHSDGECYVAARGEAERLRMAIEAMIDASELGSASDAIQHMLAIADEALYD